MRKVIGMRFTWMVVGISLIGVGLLGCGEEAIEPAHLTQVKDQTSNTQTPDPVPANSYQCKFVDGFAEGQKIADIEKKPMLVFFTAEWCRYCHEMLDEAFTQEQVIELSKRFVCIKVDADQESILCQTFHVEGFPTIQFMTPSGVPLNRLIGKRGHHELIPQMQAALQAVAKREQNAGGSVLR